MLLNRAYAQDRNERRSEGYLAVMDAEDFVSDVLEAAGSLRPKLAPAKPDVEPTVEHDAYPCPMAGAPAQPNEFTYKPAREYRRMDVDTNAGPGVDHDWEFRV